MTDCLVEPDITTVVMESTGVYWIPGFEILESRGLEVKLVNARHVKNVADLPYMRQRENFVRYRAFISSVSKRHCGRWTCCWIMSWRTLPVNPVELAKYRDRLCKKSLRGFCRRMKSKLGSSKAITGTAHNLSCLVYTLLKNGSDYVILPKTTISDSTIISDSTMTGSWKTWRKRLKIWASCWCQKRPLAKMRYWKRACLLMQAK